MATQTTNYGLTKPDQTDTYNVDDFNKNMDTIDGVLKKAITTNLMTGAEASTDGLQGLVPAPVHGQQNQVLTGSGTFKDLLSLLTAFTGATASADGAIGAVPAPTKGQQNCVLLGSGIWSSLIELVHPIGSLYWSAKNTDPSTLFGGTWEQIKDKFVLAAGDTYSAGATGGEEKHTLSANEMPQHDHTFSGSTNTTGSHHHYSVDGITVASMDTQDQATNTGSNDVYYGNDGRYNGNMMPGVTSTDGDHSHTFGGTTDSTGSNGAHNNMPPYVVMYCWQRTA